MFVFVVGMRFNCKVRRKRLKPAQRRTLVTEGHKPLIKYLKKIMLIEKVDDCDVICVACRLSCTKEMALKRAQKANLHLIN